MKVDYRFEPTYSRDDGGWYVEVYDDTGKTLHTTGVCESVGLAMVEARKWCEENSKKGAKS